MKTIKIKDKEYPLHFGKSFLYRMEHESGISITQFESLMQSKPIETMTNLLLCSIQEGLRITGKTANITIYEIMDGWDEDEGLMERVMNMLNEGLSDQKKNKSVQPGNESGDVVWVEPEGH